MHKLYELKDKLVEELESYADNGKITANDAEAIKYLASAADHIDEFCRKSEDDEMSYADGMGGNAGRSYRGYSREGRGYSRESRGGYSNARGRMNAQRDSRGRYSGADGDLEDIKRDVMELAEKVKQM